ncbi:MAG: Gfo/Idh/MocA family oxidoreductase, partial [Anaerolineae bacterium]|nr:Gfo/Idh/MocA family oxidoreductase [Anaerolineae bacterium]
MKPTLNVGLIGLGFIGKVHALAYRAAPLCLQNPVVHPCLHAVLRRHIAPADTLWRDAGFTLATDDPDHFYAQPLDIVDLCTPTFRHREEARQAMQAGMAVYCEKPLAHTLEDARAMAALAAETGALTKVAFVLRYLPAIRQMKALLSAGALGEVLHFRAHMFHESYLNPQRPMSWRLRKAQAGGGAFMDLGAHLVDLVRYLLGDIAAVRGHTRTFIPRRPVKGADLATVDVDDWTLATLTLKNGAVGTLETSRMAAGSRESTACEIYGRRGALIFHAQDPHAVRYHDLETGRWCEGHI